MDNQTPLAFWISLVSWVSVIALLWAVVLRYTPLDMVSVFAFVFFLIIGIFSAAIMSSKGGQSGRIDN